MSELTAIKTAAGRAEARPAVKRRKMNALDLMGVFAGGLMALAISVEGISPVTKSGAIETGAQMDSANTPVTQTVAYQAAPVTPIAKGQKPVSQTTLENG